MGRGLGQSGGRFDAVERMRDAREGRDSVDIRQALGTLEGALFGRSEPAVQIGRYPVIKRLGSGGTGVVYLADDPELDRHVALKLLRPEVLGSEGDEHGQARLRREARALAQLAHPNVVGVYDVGTAHEASSHRGARVFIVMEYVEGPTLAEWFRGGQRGWQEVVQALMAAGRGLAAAHSLGLVHRDFKPANVILGRDGRVRVLDFGLARLHASAEDITGGGPGRASSAETIEASPRLGEGLTTAGMILGTPLYMAPEQHRGALADARSDQFGFCASLFEGLYRRPPFTAASERELARLKLDGDLSTPTSPRVPPRIRAAVLRGLAPDPADRWPSVDELLGELRAAQSSGSSARRFAAGGVLAATAIGLASASASGGVDKCAGADTKVAETWNEDRRAQVGRAFDATGLPYARDTSLRVADRLDVYTTQWSDQYRVVCEAALAAERLDLGMGCLNRRLAGLEALMGVLVDADASVVEHAVATVASLEAPNSCGELPREPDEDVAPIREQIDRARVLRRAGRHDEGTAIVTDALADARALGHASLTADALIVLGWLQDEDGHYEAASATYSEAYFLAAASHHDDLAAQAATDLVFELGYRLARHEEGLSWSRHALAQLSKLEAPERIVGQLHNNRGLIYESRGDLDEAVDEYERSLAQAERVYGGQHTSVAAALNNLGVALQRLARLDEAAGHHQRALAIRVQELGPSHPEVAMSRHNLCYLEHLQGQNEAAAEQCRQAIAIREQALGADHPLVARSLTNLGVALKGLGRIDEAIAHYQRARFITTRALGPDHPTNAMMINNLGSALQVQSRWSEALAFHAEGLELIERTLAPDHPLAASAHANIGGIQRFLGQPGEALPHHLRALAIDEQRLGSDHPAVTNGLIEVGRAELELGHPRRAAAFLDRALGRLASEPETPRIASLRFALARALQDSGQSAGYARALAHSARAGLEGAGADEDWQREELAEIQRWLRAH